ncbi:MAG: hypothetical protein JKX85_13890 [Phycisphaeraceae bacterium]|nr:hypothetical protein [Phycisphaeraceae bacterium]
MFISRIQKNGWRQSLLSVVLVLAATSCSTASQVKVENFGPGGGGTLGCLAFEKDNPQVVDAGLDCGGMHATTDGGKTWKNAGKGIVYDGHVNFNTHCGVLALSNGVALCTSRTGKIYRTKNYGDNWKRVFANNPKGPGSSIGFLLQSPHDPQVVYAASGMGVHGARKAKHRDHWNGEIYVSKKAGRKGTWSRLNTDSKNNLPSTAHIATLTIDSLDPDLMYATTAQGIYRSKNGGVSWFNIQNNLMDGNPVQVVAPQGLSKTVYVTVGYWGKINSKVRPGVYKSTDAGETWKAVSSGLPEKEKRFFALAADPLNPQVLYVGAWSWNGGLYRTIDGGKTWQVILNKALITGDESNQTWHPDKYHVGVGVSVQVGGQDANKDGLSDAIWLSGDNVGLIWNSMDGGATWKQATTHKKGNAVTGNGRIELACVRRIVFNPKDSSNIFLTDFDWGIFESKDQARTWNMIGGPHYNGQLGGSGRSIVFDPDDQTTIYSAIGRNAGAIGGIVIRKPNQRFRIFAGRKNQLRGLPNNSISAMAIFYIKQGQKRQKYLYASSGKHGVFRINLSNPKAVFEKVNEGLVHEKSLSAYDMKHVPGTSRLYLSTPDGIYRSDNAKSWKKLTGPETAYPVLTAIRELAVDPQNPDRIFAAQMDTWKASKTQGLYVSNDAGETWTMAAQIPMPYGLAKEVGDSVLVATQAHGVYRVSWNKEKSKWVSKVFADHTNGLNHPRCWTVSVAPDDPSRVYIGTHGGFIYEAIETK